MSLFNLLVFCVGHDGSRSTCSFPKRNLFVLVLLFFRKHEGKVYILYIRNCLQCFCCIVFICVLYDWCLMNVLVLRFAFQTLLLDEELMLCDCPGLVFPQFVSTKAEMVCSGILPIDQMRDHEGPVNFVCHKIPRFILQKLYGIMLPKPQEGEDPDRPPLPLELLMSYGCKCTSEVLRAQFLSLNICLQWRQSMVPRVFMWKFCSSILLRNKPCLIVVANFQFVVFWGCLI